MHRFITGVVLFCLFWPVALKAESYSQKEAVIDSLFGVFNETLRNIPELEAEKRLRIRSLDEQYDMTTKDTPKLELNFLIYLEYRHFRYDSAMYYLNRNLEILEHHPDQHLLDLHNLHLCNLYISNGVYWEAEHVLKKLKRKEVFQEHKGLLLDTEIRLNYYLYETMVSPINKKIYLEKFHSMIDTLGRVGMSVHDLFFDIRFYYYQQVRDYDRMEQLADSLIHVPDRADRAYSIACQWKSYLYKMQHDQYNHLRYLLLSADAEQRNCIKTGRSTFQLAKQMFDYDDIQRAHQFVAVVQQDADLSNSLRHKARASELSALVSQKYEFEIKKQRDNLYRSLLIICALSLVLLVMILFLILQMRKLAVTRNKLRESNGIQVELNDKLRNFNGMLLQNNALKEEYIGLFLQSRPYYIENLNDYRKQVMRFVKDKNYRDLYDFCKSDKKISEEYEKSHQEFDRMFLDIYPDFVTEFNALLREDARVIPKTGELTIEMRIYALIRLEVNDSNQIARYLNYSLNTIYNYRSRIKLKAIIPKEDFENAVKQIGNTYH